MTLNDLECQCVVIAMSVVTKVLRLESRDVCYKVAIYLNYPNIEFDDEIKGNPFKFQAYISH